MFYDKELKAIKKSNRYRSRKIFDDNLKDFASNDYLGLAHNKELHTTTCKEMDRLYTHSAKASMLVNGYTKAHRDFEKALCKANGFEDGIVMQSGFCANIALIEALCRKGDVVFMDEQYHASGVLASRLESVNVVYFAHNDASELLRLLEIHKANRAIIAVEGIYSMSGDMCKKEFFDIADEKNAILIVDEAHSSGVVGKNLMGVFDHYEINIKPNHIKLGTLGKAYGGFGAYVLASCEIVEYLLNRSKPLIYATALSLYDTILANKTLAYILKHKEWLKKEIKTRQNIAKEIFGVEMIGLILPLHVGDNKKVIQIQQKLIDDGYIVGAIRQPTVNSALLRVIARLEYEEKEFKKLCENIRREI